MPAGLHDKRVAIQTSTATLDAGGNASYAWATAATRWGSLEDESGRELWRARKVDPDVSAVVVLREQYDGLAPDDRLVIDGRTFNIKSVLGKSDRTPKQGQIVHCMEEV